MIYCYSGVCHMAASAALHFAGYGYPVMELDGGFEEWKKHEFPIVS
ncbi:MAG: rhodanese-like domain-containing protein [Planctomycetota bacterium]